MKKILLSLLIITVAFSANAQSTATSSGLTFYNVMLGLIFLLAVVLLITTITLQRTLTSLKKEIRGENYDDGLSMWEKLLSLKPLSAEKDIELEHEYDGIKELNNPIPPWFNFLFYGTVVFAVCYLIVYHVIDAAPLQGQEYKNEMAAAKIQKDEYIKKAGNLIDENNVTLLTDGSKLEAAKKMFAEKCVVCHRADAGGQVGPNLTDEYWLHGGTVKDIFKTIKYGVPAKGMVSWENVIKPNEIQQLASYILSLQGSHPANPKEPQGEKMGGTAAAASDSTKTDSVSAKK